MAIEMRDRSTGIRSPAVQRRLQDPNLDQLVLDLEVVELLPSEIRKPDQILLVGPGNPAFPACDPVAMELELQVWSQLRHQLDLLPNVHAA